MYTYNLQSALEFLHFHFSSGVSYSTLNCYKSALSLILDINDSDERILKRFLKGAFNIKPSSPRYSITWDPRPVLEHLETLMPLTSLTLQNLTLKLVTLLALISAHRIQTLTKISLENIVHYADRVEIRIPQRVKTTTPGRLQPNLVLPYFKDRPGLCAAMTLKTYINVTTTIRPENSKQVILTFKKPHRAASSQTISRWIKKTLQSSGINTETFSAHSTRHASTSAANRAGVSIDVIKKTAGWTSQSGAFAKFYNKPLAPEPCQYAQGVLNSLTTNM
ncbi:hypothetical protein NQ315_000017 [Exocentrus adspersus]|uniref:Tyr recombinase domain-containing protein n=1 Tax=Exocentrus adspersus TaxID=1586481 RepID=A0AAV8VF54_9CUCU|nr:hypothetical protein NQ315_000017 [Exocentrus adspersus]